jgi:hypothetical protein
MFSHLLSVYLPFSKLYPSPTFDIFQVGHCLGTLKNVQFCDSFVMGQEGVQIERVGVTQNPAFQCQELP